MNSNHLLLALTDGARAAEAHGEHGLAETLTAMTKSLVESQRHQEDVYLWRENDLRAIFDAAGR
jgi:hypothetical protein